MEVIKALPDYVSEKSRTSFRSVGWRPKEEQVFEVDCQESVEVCDYFGRTKNHLIVFTGQSRDQFEVYHGEIDFQAIEKFAKDVRKKV